LIDNEITPGIQFGFWNFKAVKLEFLADNSDDPVSTASGFVILDGDEFYLFTCWHAVTGIDFFEPKVIEPPKRRRVCVRMKKITPLSAECALIGGDYSFISPLYEPDEPHKPRWQQEFMHREKPDLNGIGVFVPRTVDLVVLPLGRNENFGTYVHFEQTDIFTKGLNVGDSVLIGGFPYGYSAQGKDSPEPIFLQRSIAATHTTNSSIHLIDGVGARGMSGSPVLFKSEVGWKLFGIYCGALNTSEGASKLEKKEDNVYAALGVITPLLSASFLY
jgi:hypothetical protein